MRRGDGARYLSKIGRDLGVPPESGRPPSVDHKRQPEGGCHYRNHFDHRKVRCDGLNTP